MALDGTPIIVKKKKAHTHAHHGGSWKVAYADFVTAMMAFFMVLWIMGLSDQTRTQVAGYFNDPMGYSKTPPLSKNIIKMPNMESPKPGESKAPGSQQATGPSSIQSEIKKIFKISDPGIRALIKQTDVTWGKDGIRIEFSESKNTEFFKLGDKELTPQATTFIKLLVPGLKSLGSTMSIEGYTDAKPYSGLYDNLNLSVDRACSLKQALQVDGVPKTDFTSVIGYGDQRLKYPNDPFAVQNRRVTIWIHPGQIPEKLIQMEDIALKSEAKDAIKPPAPDLGPDEPKLAQR